mmetsp:Transcript_59319/g.105452  ORF Transcript_59319/g.105452 Transcript_59319/m.105452 type:complete len:202 (+) Transcript_59319:906-1511(+)
MAPPKILGAASWEKGTTRGSWLAETKVLISSAEKSPSKLLRFSSKSLNRATPGAVTEYLAATSLLVVMPKGTSSLLAAAARKALASALSADSKKPMTETSAFSTKASAASVESRSLAGGPDFLFTQFTISLLVRPPPYSVGLPPRKNLRVGKPWTSNFSANSRFSVASTLARKRGGSWEPNSSAAAAYSGARRLQWPHQGA